jgi:hypothetical protein
MAGTFTPLTAEQYQSAQAAGFSPDQILQNEQTRKSQSIKPIGSSEGAGGNNWAQSMLQGPLTTLITRPAIRAEQAVLSGVGHLVGGKTGERLQNTANTPVNIPMGIFGTSTVEPQKPIDQGGASQIAGHGLETASYLLPADRAAAAGENLFKGAIGSASGGGALAGGQFGFLSGAGGVLTNNNDPSGGQILGGATVSGLLGMAGGGLFGASGALASNSLKSAIPTLTDLITKGVDKTGQDVGRTIIENGFRDTANKYPSNAGLLLHNMENQNGTNPLGVLSSYGKNTVPDMGGERGAIDPTDQIDFLKEQIRKLGGIKTDAVQANDQGISITQLIKTAYQQIKNQGWSILKQKAAQVGVDKIFARIGEAYPEGVVPLTEVDTIKSEQAGLSKSYNNKKAEPFELDAHAVVGSSAKTTVEDATQDGPTKEFNKFIQSHYDAIDLLEALRGKTPHGGMLTKQFGRLTAQGVGAGVGAATGGSPILGAIAGRGAMDSIDGIFNNNFISNPLKRMLVSNLKDVPAPVIQQMLDYIDKTMAEKGSRLSLPAPKQGGFPVLNNGNPVITPHTSYEAPANQSFNTSTNKTGDIYQRDLKTGKMSIFPKKK